jgi:hypothetical protein
MAEIASALGHAVGDGAAGDGEQQYRAPVHHVDEPQQQRRVRERQDQPGFGQRVHPGRDLGDRLGDEEDAEVPRAQRAEGLGPAHRRIRTC